MRSTRVYVYDQDLAQEKITLTNQPAKHLLQVLRIKTGQPVILFDDSGYQYDAVVIKTSKNKVDVEIKNRQLVENESPCKITLLQGISRGERMDLVIQKSTELGVTSIQPMFTRRSMVKLEGDRLARRIEHWHNIIVSACEQCGRNKLPLLSEPVSFHDAINQIPAGKGFFMDPDSNTGFHDIKESMDITLAIGPEGGFDETEKEYLKQQNIQPVKLGPRILRTETAAIAAITALGFLHGDL